MINGKGHMMGKGLLIAGFAVLVSACTGQYQNIDLETPSLRMESKMQASTTKVKKSWPVTVNADGAVEAMAKDYTGRGDGPVQVMVTYAADQCDKKESKNRENAAGQAQYIRQQFARQGVRGVAVRVAPTPEEKAGLAVVSYNALVIQQPDECRGKSLISVDGHIDNMMGYPIGCDSQKIMAQMVSNKKDLLGKTKMDPASSSHLGAAMEGYNSGETVGEDDLSVTTTQLSTAGQ